MTPNVLHLSIFFYPLPSSFETDPNEQVDHVHNWVESMKTVDDGSCVGTKWNDACFLSSQIILGSKGVA
jgi:hypothetical protein